MKGLVEFFNIIGRLAGLITDYHNIKSDEDLRPKSKMFGVRSIILSSIGIILVVLFANLTVRTVQALSSGDIAVLLNLFFLLVLIIIDIFIIGYFLIYPLICWILQINLNKKAIGWIAMALWIILFIISIGSMFIIPRMF